MAKTVLTGEHFMQGDIACAEGALAAGCKFFGGYPITPASEIAERMALRLPQVGGYYIQMEDELASIAAVIGASYAGLKSMTATSGPGFSLMQENIGLAVMTEAPCVIANIMRGSPSTGQPTKPGQGDIMQAKWGSHGDYEIIALAPNSVQEMFDLTIKAFNLSEQYRVPAYVMADGLLGHLYEKLIIPSPEEINIVDRKKPQVPPKQYLPFYVAPGEFVPPMACFGEGYHFYATGLTHNEYGYPDMSDEAHVELVTRLCDKIRKNVDKIVDIRTLMTDDADVVIVAYGSTARSALRTVKEAREKGIKAGLIRLVTLWPFPDKQIKEIAGRVKGIVVAEMNYGQINREVERVASPTRVISFPKPCGDPPTPEELLNEVRRIVK